MSQQTFSVSEVNNQIKNLVETRFNLITIKGEITGFKISHNHMYFTIKDEFSSLPCAVWYFANKIRDYIPNDGDKVILSGKLSFWTKGGALKFNVESLKKSGEGDLWAKFQLLKKKLYDKGLFDNSFKKKLPRYPRKVGIITSESGAVIQDIMNVIYNNSSYLNVVLRNSIMQGESASLDVIEAIREFNNYKQKIDLIIIARGGGSIEDLWCFNDEKLANEIFNSNIPIVTAIGHETDTTIADYVSDYRAGTPSIAAKIIAPSTIDCIQDIDSFEQKFINIINNRIDKLKLWLNTVDQRHGLHKAKYVLYNHHEKFKRMKKSIDPLKIGSLLKTKYDILDRLTKDLNINFNLKMNGLNNDLNTIIKLLNSYNPKNVMKKGYSIVYDGNKVLKNVNEILLKQELRIKFYKGSIKVKAIDIDQKGN